jgi:hypothetical protein
VPLQLVGDARALVEEFVLHHLDLVVERLDGLEVSIDDHVQQPVDQRARTVLDQVAVVVPATHYYFFDVEGRVQPYGHEAARQAEGRHTSDRELGARAVVLHRVRRHEEVRRVSSRLGSFVFGDGVLDRVPVESEFLTELHEVVLVRSADVRPDKAVWFLQVVGYLLQGEVLCLECPVSPHSRSHALRRHGTSVPWRTKISRTDA